MEWTNKQTDTSKCSNKVLENQHGMTPFHYACKNGQLDMIPEGFFCDKIQMGHFWYLFTLCITIMGKIPDLLVTFYSSHAERKASRRREDRR